MRTFDLGQQFESIKKLAVDAVKSVFPIDGKNRLLRLDGVTVGDNLNPTDYSSQAKAKAGGSTWGIPVYASLTLIDKATGKPMDSSTKVKLFTLPQATPRFSYIVGGNEYQVSNQLRLKPGVYTIRKQNGELKTMVNLAQGKNFDLTFNESKGTFNISKIGGGQANIPLYPILTHLGISASAISNAWGNSVAQANASVSDPKAVSKAATAFNVKNGELKDYFDKTKMIPETSKITLGEGFDRVSGPMLLAASKKLLDVHMGRTPPEDRDSLEFKELHSLEDFIKERLEKNKDTLAFRVKRSIDHPKRTKISQIVNPGAFSSVIESFFTQDDKSATPEQTNPLEMVSGQYKATIMGSGGIKSDHAVTDDMRNIHPSQYGFIDPIHTPESSRIGANLHLPLGVIKDGKELKAAVLDKNGNTAVLTPTQAYNAKIAFPGQKGEMVRVSYKGETMTVPRNSVDYFTPSPQSLFSWSTNLIPFLPADQGNRAMMAAKMMEQAIALKHREAPLVQVGANQMGTMEQVVGKASAVIAPEDGTVKRITKDSIVLSTASGEQKIGLYDHFSLNRKSYLNHEPVVKEGQKVKKGDLLADSNFTKNGVLALGTNLKTAYIPYKGLNFDDGIVITNSAAEKLTSVHIHKKSIDIDPNTITKLSTFRAQYPNVIQPDNAKKLDDDGIIRKGQKVKMGDVVIASLQKREASTAIGVIQRQLADRPKDSSVMWTQEDEGEVVDVHKTNKGVTVFIKTEEKAKVGDKLCYDKDTEVLTKSGWKTVGNVLDEDELATLRPDGEMEYHKPIARQRYNYNGKMYRLTTQMLDIMVTPEHSLYVKRRFGRKFDLLAAVSVFGERVEHKKNALWSKYSDTEHFEIDGFKIPLSLWCKLLGYYLSEGSVSLNKKRNYEISISQVKPHSRAIIKKDLEQLPWKIQVCKDRFKIYSKALYEYLKPTGLSYQKYVPAEVFTYAPKYIQDFLSAITVGDGTRTRMYWHYFSTSKKLVDDLQILALYAGMSSDVYVRHNGTDGHIKGKPYKFRPSYSLHIRVFKHTPEVNHGHAHDQDGQEESFVDYNGEVFCFTVPNHVLMTRRNGKTVWCGNCGRHGNKGIITKIIDDHEAPKNAAGEAVDVILNPHGVISRINIGQIYESAAAKAAKKSGKPFITSNFTGENYYDSTKAFLDKHKIDDKEELFDASGKSLGKVHVGNPYILKLFKLAQGNYSVRQGGPGNAYDVNLQPLKAGGDDSAKALDLLTMYSMLSHGANANLREMATTKANQNDEYWKALKAGQTLPPPQPTFVYNKFISFLKGAGIDVKKDGTKMALAPLTDKEVLAMSSGEVKKPVFYRSKDMEPIRDGFLDPVKFGGFKGTKWGHIELHEPVINPIFETAIRKITGLGSKFDDIMAGKLHINRLGEFNKDGKGVTGALAIEKVLKEIDVDREIKLLKNKAANSTGNVLDDINKRLRYLLALQKFDMKPHEAYMRKNIPVVPPMYRPIYTLPDGSVTTSDVNLLYQNIGVLNTLAKSPVMAMLPEEEKAVLRADMYNHVRGVSGLTDLNIKGRERKGFISEIKGGAAGQPKEGFFISKGLSKRQDFVGRGTILPEPTLGVDQMGMPEQMAWKLFEPFIVRELAKFGKTPNKALDEIKAKTPLAKKALDTVMKTRHVLLNRAPSLHKFSIMAFKPQITTGTAIKIPPLVTSGFNADFDGDTMVVHTPISDEANMEAEKMLPSRNLYKPGSGRLMIAPTQEAQTGIFYLSKTAEGRKKLTKILGTKYAVTEVLNKKATEALLNKLSHEQTANEFARIVQDLKSEGEKHTFDTGFTLGMDDLHSFKKERTAILGHVNKQLSKAKNEADLVKINSEATALADHALNAKLKDKSNPLFDMVESGAKGSKSQLRSIMVSPLFVANSKGRIVPQAIKNSYTEGLDVGDYWTSMYGARRGMMDRAIQTSLPGAFSKNIMANTIDNVISAADCGTKKGVTMSIEDHDVTSRYLAGDQGGVANATLVDSMTLSKLKKAGLRTVMVRSPLTCLQAKGVCAKCYGLDEAGHVPTVGENVGAKAGQTISEPLIQLVMNTFHSGGAAGTGADVGGYKRIDQLLNLPKIVVGAAALAPKNGVVKSIKPGVAGGFDIDVSGTIVHVAQGRSLKVKVGDTVASGDMLSDGVVKPQDLVKHKGMQPAQEYIVDELRKAYGGQGVKIHRKTFETVIRSIGNTTQVLNNPKQSDFVAGDVIPYTVAKNYNENLVQKVHAEEANGYKLNRSYGALKEGHELTAKDIKALQTAGHNEIEIKKDPIEHAPMLKSVTTLPLLKRNWMSALGFRQLSKALTEGAGQSWETDVSDYHPIPAFMHGATFGKGKDGKY